MCVVLFGTDALMESEYDSFSLNQYVLNICVTIQSCVDVLKWWVFVHAYALVNMVDVKNACLYFCMYSMYVCPYVCIYACEFACMYVCKVACLHVCSYVCIYVYVCKAACLYVSAC